MNNFQFNVSLYEISSIVDDRLVAHACCCHSVREAKNCKTTKCDAFRCVSSRKVTPSTIVSQFTFEGKRVVDKTAMKYSLERGTRSHEYFIKLLLVVCETMKYNKPKK
jgi:hypothetical protein